VEKSYKQSLKPQGGYKGEIKARIIELRFAASGKLAVIQKKRGDMVKKGDLVASLDKKMLQAELDKELGDFEKVRAEFEIFNLQKGEPKDEISKYLKSGKQAELNISVKEVELAKAKLDQAELFSPVDGVVVDDSNLVTGLYITPASNPIKIVDNASYFFEFEIDQKDISFFEISQKAEVKIEGTDKVYIGNTVPIFSSKDGKFKVEIKLDDFSGLLFGLLGQVNFF